MDSRTFEDDDDDDDEGGAMIDEDDDEESDFGQQQRPTIAQQQQQQSSAAALMMAATASTVTAFAASATAFGAAADDEDEEDGAETGVCFSDPGWLASNALLTPDAALEYFSRSQFYDRLCVANVLRMQHRAPTPEILRQMRGVDYAVDVQSSAPPALWVVRKGMRTAGGGGGGSDGDAAALLQPLAVYYIIDGIVYRGPTPRAVVAAAVRKSLFLLSNAVSEARAALRTLPSLWTNHQTPDAAADSEEQKQKQKMQRGAAAEPRRVTTRCSALSPALLESRVDKAIQNIDALAAEFEQLQR